MSDGHALLRAILDDPDDDAPRLIYADWLEENGDPARAAFIRAQIKLARLPQDDPDRDRLVQIDRTLWKANRDAWKAWLPSWVKVTEFHRGFVEEIRCFAEDFLARADEVRLRTPLLAVRLDGTTDVAVPLFRSRSLDGLRGAPFNWHRARRLAVFGGMPLSDQFDYSRSQFECSRGRVGLRADSFVGVPRAEVASLALVCPGRRQHGPFGEPPVD